MPDGDFLQSDKKRDGLLARAGSRFEEFRQQLGRIFEAAEAKKQTKDAKMQAVLAIAEADIKRLQEQARPIDEMVTQAKKDATLLGVHLSLRNVMGEVYEKTDIPEATREKIQAALKVFRSGLVEVLGEEKRGIEQTPSIAQALKEELGADKVSIEGEVMGESADEPQALEEPAAGPAFLERKGPSDAIKYRDLLSKLQKKFDSLSAFGDSPSEKDQAIVKALSRLQECTEARELYEGAATMDARNAAWERVLEFEWSDIAAELKEYTREVTKDRDAQVKVKERTEIDTKSRLDADTRLAIAEELQVFIAGEGDEMPEKKRKKAPPKRDPRELKPRTPGEREIANVITASAGQGGRVDIYDMKGKRELVLTSDGIHDNLKKKEIKIILSGRYEELEDAELREGLKGITDPMEALATAARIRSKQKGNPRAKPDDMTAVLVASKNPSEAVRTAVPGVDAKDVPVVEKVEGEKKIAEEEKAILRESITGDRAVLEMSKEKLEKGIVIYQGAVHVPYLRQVVDWFEKLIEAKQDVVSKWNFPEEKQKSKQNLATYERNLPKRHRMTMKGQIKELQGYLDASAKKITELEKQSEDKKELKEELRQTKNWQDEVKFALDIVEGIYKRTEAHEEDVMPSSLKVTTASTPSPDTSAPAEAPPAPGSLDTPAPPSTTDHTAPDTIPPASGAPPAMPPAPLGLPPLPTFAHPDLFRQGDRSFLEGWLKDQQTRLGYVRNMIAEPALTDARKRHPSFDVHAGRFEKVIEATEKLTQASTEAERLSAERALQDLREQGPWPIGSAEALAGLKEQQTYAQENLGYYKAANSKSEKIKEAIAQAKAKLEEVNADIYLMELDAQLEQALSEVTLLKDEGKKDELGERIATNEQKAETRETDWKKVAAESEEAQTKFIAAMETREIYDESEPTFGPIFTAFQREQEATIDLNKALRQFNVLDATETRITQTLRLLDREGSGPVSEQVWAAMPGMVRVFLRTVHEDQNSTVGNIKARLYERLRGITQDKIEANKELQQTAQLIEGLREKSSYVLALNAYQKMERETKELKNALHSLKGELEEHNPATAKKTGDRVYFIEKTQELTARYELLQNQYERKQSLLQDAQGLVELSQKALWGQAQQLDEEATVTEASAYKALEAQADIANGLIKIIEGQKLHKNKQASQEVREAELRKSLPSQPTVVGGANVFGRGGGEQTNRTSGGAKEEPSFWQQAQKWPGVGSIIKGGKDLLSAFGIDLN